MKFWKQTLLTTLAFFGIATTVLYTACEQDPCNTLVCLNGGSCSSGLCQCPTGYEGSNCSTRTISRYLGTYIGSTTCNMSTAVPDTVVVWPSKDSMSVVVLQYSNITDTLMGTVATTETNGTITFPSDSSNNYLKNITASLDGTKLTLFTNEITDVANNVQNNCTFIGTK
jgi:hypothetical protein